MDFMATGFCLKAFQPSCYQKPPFLLTKQILDELAATATKKIRYFIG
jgi:adenosylmethionine-8-amino-7-oxononanoate aminotransferase